MDQKGCLYDYINETPHWTVRSKIFETYFNRKGLSYTT